MQWKRSKMALVYQINAFEVREVTSPFYVNIRDWKWTFNKPQEDSLKDI